MKRKTVQKLILSVGLFCTVLPVSAFADSVSPLTYNAPFNLETFGEFTGELTGDCLSTFSFGGDPASLTVSADLSTYLSFFGIGSAGPFAPGENLGISTGATGDFYVVMNVADSNLCTGSVVTLEDVYLDPYPANVFHITPISSPIPEANFANGILASLYTTSSEVVETNLPQIFLIGLAIFLILLFYDYLLGIVEEKKKYKFVFGEFGAKSKDVEIRFSKDAYGNPIGSSEKKKRSATQTYMKTKEFKNWAKKNKIRY